MRLPLVASAASLLLAPFSAAAQDLWGSHEFDGFYAGLSAGLLLTTDNDGQGFVLGVQAGYKYGVFRPELEFEYGRVDGNDFDGDLNLYRMTGGLYYDIDTVTRLTPYFGGGLGGVYLDRDDDVNFTAHGEGGLAIRVTDNISVVPAYRFLWIDDAGSGFDDDTAHIVKLGGRLRF